MASIDCAFANRQIITHLTRRVFGHLFPQAKLDLLFDVSHNSCKRQVHRVAGQERGGIGTRSAIMAGAGDGAEGAFASACHGAGRQLSRHQALRRWYGRQVVDDPATIGIIVRSPSSCGIAEEAPGAYKDIGAVVDAARATCLARKVAMMAPVVCIKGQPRPQRGRQ